MRIYFNKDLKEEAKAIDLGIVIAGEKKEYIYYLHNDAEVKLENIKCAIDNMEVKLISFPKELKSKEIGEIKFEWSPSVTVKKGLKAEINVTGEEIYS